MSTDNDSVFVTPTVTTTISDLTNTISHDKTTMSTFYLTFNLNEVYLDPLSDELIRDKDMYFNVMEAFGRAMGQFIKCLPGTVPSDVVNISNQQVVERGEVYHKLHSHVLCRIEKKNKARVQLDYKIIVDFMQNEFTLYKRKLGVLRADEKANRPHFDCRVVRNNSISIEQYLEKHVAPR